MPIRSPPGICSARQGRSRFSPRWIPRSPIACGCATGDFFPFSDMRERRRSRPAARLPGHPDQDLPRRRHRSGGRSGRQALRRPEHGLRLSGKAGRRLHLQWQNRGRAGQYIGQGRSDPAGRDIVATNSGLMVYNGGVRRQNFTPIAASSAVPAELRRSCPRPRSPPALATAAPPADVKQGDNVAAVRKKNAFSSRDSSSPPPCDPPSAGVVVCLD